MRPDRLLRLLLGLLILGLSGFAILNLSQNEIESLFDEANSLFSADSPLGPLAFILMQATATALLIPASFFTLAAGAIYGPALGTLVNVVGVTLGAMLGFLIARHLAGASIRRRIEQSDSRRLEAVMEGVEEEGWRFVAFSRLVPGFPFFLMNYLFGITRIGLLPYLMATGLAVLPSLFAFSYLGHAGRQLLNGEDNTMLLLLGVTGAVAIVVFVPRFVATFRRRLMSVESADDAGAKR